jgi:hypothetical protein
VAPPSPSLKLFRHLYDGPVYAERATGTADCPEYCLYVAELGACLAKCECAYVREILQIVRQWPKAGRSPGLRGRVGVWDSDQGGRQQGIAPTHFTFCRVSWASGRIKGPRSIFAGGIVRGGKGGTRLRRGSGPARPTPALSPPKGWPRDTRAGRVPKRDPLRLGSRCPRHLSRFTVPTDRSQGDKLSVRCTGLMNESRGNAQARGRTMEPGPSCPWSPGQIRLGPPLRRSQFYYLSRFSMLSSLRQRFD